MLTATYYVYLLASERNGTLYVGFTSDIARRLVEHKNKVFAGFTSRYNVARLVWFQTFSDIGEAQTFEKRLKRWRRDWKIKLIEDANPHWQDLSYHFLAE